eukprot:6197142-Pleurochrysis_carterae.AAC.1
MQTKHSDQRSLGHAREKFQPDVMQSTLARLNNQNVIVGVKSFKNLRTAALICNRLNPSVMLAGVGLQYRRATCRPNEM